MARLSIGGKDEEVEVPKGESAVVLEGTKGAARTVFDGVAACLEGGTAHASKRGVAFVLQGGKREAKTADASVGDGAVAVVLNDGLASCFQSAIASSVSNGSVAVHGRGSLGVVLTPSLDDKSPSTGTLPAKPKGQSLLLFADLTDVKNIRWVIGVTGDPNDTLLVQGGLKCGVNYRLKGGKLVEA